jgi:hypothetical protein
MRSLLKLLRGLRISAKSLAIFAASVFFILSFALNIILMTWNAGAMAVAGTFSAVTGISTTIADLQNTTHALTSENTKLKEINAETKIKNKEATKLSKRISARTLKGAVRNAAVAPAEAIPNVGLAVILGVTAYELADACATMKDIKTLNSLLGDKTAIDENTVCGIQTPTKEAILNTLKESPSSAWQAATTFELEVPAWDGLKEKGSSILGESLDAFTRAMQWHE